MKFGFPPKFIKNYPIKDLGKEKTLVLALAAVKSLGWNISEQNGNGFVAYTSMSLLSWNEEVKIVVHDSSIDFNSRCLSSQLIDWGKNEKNGRDFLGEFVKQKNNFSEEDYSLKLAAVEVQSHTEADTTSHSVEIKEEPPSSLASFFIPREGYFFTPILLYLNLIVFVVMVSAGVHLLLPSGEDIINWGGNFKPLTLNGEWWRLLTSCFLHIGVFHLLMNMYALLYIGLLLEPHLGKLRFISAYLLSGIAASTASLFWNDLTISAGASGAIFGMYGLFLAMLTTNFIEKSARKALLTSMVVFVGYNLLGGLKEDIDNAAHIGGLISGIVIGYAFYPSLKNPANLLLKKVTVGILYVFTILGSYAFYKSTPNYIAEYDKKFEEFVVMEEMALEIFDMLETASTEELLTEIEERSIYYWEENIKLLNELDEMDLPEELHKRNKILLEYCDLRIQSCEVLYQAIEEDSDLYIKEFESYTDKINLLIEGL